MVERICYELSWMSLLCGKEYGLQPCTIDLFSAAGDILTVRRWRAGSACNTSAICVGRALSMWTRIRISHFLGTGAMGDFLTETRMMMSETNSNIIESPLAMF